MVTGGRSRVGVPVVLAACLLASWGRAGEVTADVKLGENGLARLAVGETNVLADGRPRLDYAVFEEAGTGDGGFKKYGFDRAEAAEPQARFDRRQSRLRHGCAWGAIELRYRPRRDGLDVSVTIRNDSDRTLADFGLTLMRLRFPGTPKGMKKGRAMIASSLDNLAAVEAAFGEAKLVAACESLHPPVRFGFGKPVDEEAREYPVVLKGGVNAFGPGAYEIYPHGLPRVPPGQSLTLALSFRFAPAEEPTHEILPDLYRKFREHHAQGLSWKDRRPIGAIFLPSGKGPAGNPRNWFKKAELDVKTPEGRAELRSLFMQFADRCVAELKRMDAQGMTVWNMEGEENPHPISYIGDPRMAKLLAPEADEIYDEFFKRFREAGLRTGCTLRPTQVYYNEKKKQWAHGTGSHGPERNPLGDDFHDLWPKGVPWWRFYPVAERLCRKIEYAKRRFGCTIFYVDTNGVWRQVGEKQEFKWGLLESHVWREVVRRHPDVLLIPELRSGPAQWAYTAQYLQPPYSPGRTPERVKRLLPDAFSVCYIVNLKKRDFLKRRPEFVEGVRRGDALFFRGWFHDSYNDELTKIYDEARGIERPGPAGRKPDGKPDELDLDGLLGE